MLVPVHGSPTDEVTEMTRRMTVYAGLLLPVMAVIAGVALGRIIEAIALAVVLFAVWTWVRRVMTAPDARIPGRGSDPWA
jgi:hypothetical protein